MAYHVPLANNSGSSLLYFFFKKSITLLCGVVLHVSFKFKTTTTPIHHLYNSFPFGCAAPLLAKNLSFLGPLRRKLSTERFPDCVNNWYTYNKHSGPVGITSQPTTMDFDLDENDLAEIDSRGITPTRDGGALGGGVGSGSSSANMISTSSERRNGGATYSSIDLEHEVANEDPRTLRKAIMNERAAPHILPYEQSAVEDLTEVIRNQQKIIDDVMDYQPKNKKEEIADDKFAASLYQMEVTRLNYIVTSYHRTRLRKIQQYPMHIYRDSELRQRLSKAELAFLSNYIDLISRHMEQTVTNNLPPQFRSLTDEGSGGSVSMIPHPNLNKYVFMKAKEDVGDIEIVDGPEGVQTINKDDIFAVIYEPIEHLLLDGKIELI